MVLAGKVNLEGELLLSKNIPYTLETLAIEFNRGTDEIKVAVDVLIELQMIEFTEDGIYMVKNFAKHQNIKTRKKIENKTNEMDLINKDISKIDNNIPTFLEMKKNKRVNKRASKDNCIDVTDGETEDNSMFSIVSGDLSSTLDKGVALVGRWSFDSKSTAAT